MDDGQGINRMRQEERNQLQSSDPKSKNGGRSRAESSVHVAVRLMFDLSAILEESRAPCFQQVFVPRRRRVDLLMRWSLSRDEN